MNPEFYSLDTLLEEQENRAYFFLGFSAWYRLVTLRHQLSNENNQ